MKTEMIYYTPQNGGRTVRKCPVCHQSFNRRMLLHKSLSKPMSGLLGEHLTDGKGVIRCPHCKARLRKKMSVWFIPALLPFLVSAVLYSTNHSLWFLMVLSIVLFMLFYIMNCRLLRLIFTFSLDFSTRSLTYYPY